MTDQLKTARTLARRVDQAEERLKILRAVRDQTFIAAVQAGHSTREIGRVCGVSGERVSKVVRDALGSRGAFGRGEDS